MMPLQYLFANDALAAAMLTRWGGDGGEPVFWRASANIVYRCERDGATCGVISTKWD